MLTTDRAEWSEAVAAWDGQRIRKVVRRGPGRGVAPGAHRRRAGRRHGTAELRVYPPVPVDGWPPELARLQVGGTMLDDPEPPPPAPTTCRLVLLRPHAEMATGKAMAQAAHAAQLGWRSLRRRPRARWRQAGFPLAVRDATEQQWAAALRAGAPVVHDGGFTEVEPGQPPHAAGSSLSASVGSEQRS